MASSSGPMNEGVYVPNMFGGEEAEGLEAPDDAHVHANPGAKSRKGAGETLSVAQAEALGIPTIIPLRFLDHPDRESKKVVLKKSAKDRSELTNEARLNLYLDALYLQEKIVQDKMLRLRSGEKACVGKVTREKYRAGDLAAHYKVFETTVKKIYKEFRDKPLAFQPQKSTRGRKRTIHET